MRRPEWEASNNEALANLLPHPWSIDPAFGREVPVVVTPSVEHFDCVELDKKIQRCAQLCASRIREQQKGARSQRVLASNFGFKSIAEAHRHKMSVSNGTERT